MRTEKRRSENVLPFDSRGHPHIFFALFSPYALYAPLLGVGVFSAFFLLRELHTVHKTAYGRRWNQALALLPVGIGAPPARANRKCIRICIRISADSRRNRPSGELIRLRLSLILLDALAVFCPCMPFFGPSDGLSCFWGIVFRTIRAVPQGPPRIRFSGNGGDWNEKRPGNVIVFWSALRLLRRDRRHPPLRLVSHLLVRMPSPP